jgi:hypothetical protein
LRNRLKRLERALGERLPQELVEVLVSGPHIEEGSVGFRSRGRFFEVRTTYKLDQSGGSHQVDAVYRRVGDVLPYGKLPFACDWAGNFYCLSLDGSYEGKVVYWDHERDDFDDKVLPVAASLRAFLTKLKPVEDDE